MVGKNIFCTEPTTAAKAGQKSLVTARQAQRANQGRHRPLSFVLFESPFTSVSTVSRNHPSLDSLFYPSHGQRRLKGVLNLPSIRVKLCLLAGLSQWDGVHLQHPPLQLGERLLHPANRIDADDGGGDNALLVWRAAPRHRARELGGGGRVGNKKPIQKTHPKKTT